MKSEDLIAEYFFVYFCAFSWLNFPSFTGLALITW
jgi:hypothetical protein